MGSDGTQHEHCFVVFGQTRELLPVYLCDFFCQRFLKLFFLLVFGQLSSTADLRGTSMQGLSISDGFVISLADYHKRQKPQKMQKTTEHCEVHS